MRYKWYKFRKHFNKLRLRPILNYSLFRQITKDNSSLPQDKENSFRLFGKFESVTDGKILWIRSEDLTVPVLLKNAETYLLQMQNEKNMKKTFVTDDSVPEKIRWDKVSALIENTKVCVCGDLLYHDGQWAFASTKENPLVIFFYDGHDDDLATYATRVCRSRKEYWNPVTPYSLAIGVLCHFIIIFLFLSRPAFRLTNIVSVVSLFVPLYPILPPGFLLTMAYSRLAWRARKLRSWSDIVKQPLNYMFLNLDGEKYGSIRKNKLTEQEENIPMILPEITKTKKDANWHIFGILKPGEELPEKPKDPFAVYGILPDSPSLLSRRFLARAYLSEIFAWILLLAGIGLNSFFFFLIINILF